MRPLVPCDKHPNQSARVCGICVGNLEARLVDLERTAQAAEEMRDASDARVRELEAFIATIKCGRCKAIKGTHGSPCIDQPNHDGRWAKYVGILTADSVCTSKENHEVPDLRATDGSRPDLSAMPSKPRTVPTDAGRRDALHGSDLGGGQGPALCPATSEVEQRTNEPLVEPVRHTVAGIWCVTIPADEYDRLRARPETPSAPERKKDTERAKALLWKVAGCAPTNHVKTVIDFIDEIRRSEMARLGVTPTGNTGPGIAERKKDT